MRSGHETSTWRSSSRRCRSTSRRAQERRRRYVRSRCRRDGERSGAPRRSPSSPGKRARRARGSCTRVRPPPRSTQWWSAGREGRFAQGHAGVMGDRSPQFPSITQRSRCSTACAPTCAAAPTTPSPPPASAARPLSRRAAPRRPRRPRRPSPRSRSRRSGKVRPLSRNYPEVWPSQNKLSRMSQGGSMPRGRGKRSGLRAANSDLPLALDA